MTIKTMQTSFALASVWWRLRLQLLLLLSVLSFANALWWDMARDVKQTRASTLSCEALALTYNFSADQLGMCNHYTNPRTNAHELMVPVAKGARMGYQMCLDQMGETRWGCRTKIDDPNAPVYAYGITESDGTTKEAAFVHAVMTAALSYRVVKACSDAENFLLTCACDRKPHELDPPDFSWDSCSDNVDFGNNFASKWALSDVSKGTSLASQVTRHNVVAGTKALEDVSKESLCCRCHGVCGACNLKTCWTCVPLHDIGPRLKERYNNAVRVRKENKTMVPRHDQRNLDDSLLVYMDKSLDYCSSTRGRRCNATMKSGEGSCADLCCGRGYHQTSEVKVTQECRFIWCCYLECVDKKVTVHFHECN